MVKRKDSASGGSTDDPTDNSSEGTDSFLKPTKHDLVPLILAATVIALGLTAALLSFFLLRNGEDINARNSLQFSASVSAKLLEDAITDIIAVVQSTAMMVQVSKTPITLYDQFEPYVMNGGSFPKFIDDVSYYRFIFGGGDAAFVKEMRASGISDYVNFTITGRDANNNPIPAPFNPVRCVVVQVVPTYEMKSVVGYDACTNDETAKAALATFLSNKAAVTGGKLSTTHMAAVSVTIMKSIYNTTGGFPLGMIGANMILSDLIEEALNSVISGFDASIYDANATGSESYFLYSTRSNGNYTFKSADDTRAIAEADYTASANVTFADRIFKITLVPDDTYKSKFDAPMKYIALVISLVIMGILLIGCVFLFFGRKLIIARKKRAESGIKIDLLKTNQTALRTLLDRIASQESKTRAVINALPEMIFVITSAGKILQTNAAFDSEFPFNQQEMEKGVYTWDIFTELASDFFRVSDETKEIQTTAARRFGDMIDVTVRVRDLRGKDGESSSQSNEIKPSNISSMNVAEQQEAFVIIAKSVNEKPHHEVNSQERVQRHEFERLFREKSFREELKEYCEKNKNVENILFLEQVREYKKAQFGVRVDMKSSIFDRFIKVDAPMQLNLANEVVIEEMIKINKSMGDVDLFKRIEDCVWRTLACDIYPRYLSQQVQKNS